LNDERRFQQPSARHDNKTNGSAGYVDLHPPPSTNNSLPLTWLLSSAARKTTALAISSDVPRHARLAGLNQSDDRAPVKRAASIRRHASLHFDVVSKHRERQEFMSRNLFAPICRSHPFATKVARQMPPASGILALRIVLLSNISKATSLALILLVSMVERYEIAEAKEAAMLDNKFIVQALVLSGTLAFGCASGDQGAASRSAGTSSGQSASGIQTAASAGQEKSAAKMSNADMRKVEEALKAKGYDPGAIDGEMDAQTRQALRDFQKKNKLTETGTVDQATADALEIVIVIAE
jgi:hypothetical protein